MAGHSKPVVIGKYGGFQPPRYPWRMRALGVTMGTVAWFWYFAVAKQTGPYHMGFRTPWEDHAPTAEYLEYQERAWSGSRQDAPPAKSYSPAHH